MLQHRRFLTHLVRGYPNSERVENRFFFFLSTHNNYSLGVLSRGRMCSQKKKKEKEKSP